MPHMFSKSKKEQSPNETSHSKSGDSLTGAAESNNLHLLRDQSEQGLWQQAWEQVKSEKADLVKKLPREFQHLEYWTTSNEVEYLRKEAQRRRDEQHDNERKIGGGKRTYREVCDKVANCAQKFQIVGDLVVQAEPVYAALPWACVRFFINCAVGESATYALMLETTEEVSEYIAQYPVIEQTYAKIDSELSSALRKSLLKLYKVILQFQVEALSYFDSDHKVWRTLAGLNPVKTEDIKQRHAAIEKAKGRVDDDIALVDAQVTKSGIDNLEVGQTGQREQLETIKQTLKALSGETGSVIEEQRALLSDADARQQERNDVLVGMWKEPLDDLKAKLEQEEIAREKQNLLEVRRWLSPVEPEQNYAEAREKRKLSLGDWLVEHDKFMNWQISDASSLLWLHGFAGTGKTGLVCRVIEDFRIRLDQEKAGQEPFRIAYFFCSNDKGGTGLEATTRADPEAALRSIVSQLSTSRKGRSVASIVQEKFDLYGPHGDKQRALTYADCAEIILTISRQAAVVIVLDAFDECDQDKSPKLVQQLKEILRQNPEKIKVFISTRPFPAIENELIPEDSIEVTADNNGKDVSTFIKDTLMARIKDKDLLDGHVSPELESEIESTLTARARNMFLYASLLLNQICDKNHLVDEESIRRKLTELPKTLTDVYTGVMAEIHDDNSNSERSCQIAQDTFKWLLYAQETLTPEALLEAISPPERKADRDEMLRACRNLVVLGSQSFEFAHYSVREHARQISKYSSSQCHVVATKSCLRILNKTFGAGMSRDELTSPERSFEQYALLYWPLHYEGIDKKDKEEHRTAINTMLRTFLLQGRSRKHKYQHWFDEAYEKVKPLKNNRYLASKFEAIRSSPSTPLFAACVFGLEDLIAKFGRELHELNNYNDQGQTALCLAIENNKLEAVKALLSSRFPADINLLNVKAVQQFEDSKADIVVKGPTIYASALQCAAATGRLEIAEYLITKGAHVDLVAGYYGSPLQAAAGEGHAQMVELLLKKGAEPNSQGGFHGNALQAAAAAGHSHILNILLENKPPALVNVPGGPCGSALTAAVFSGNSDTVFALLEEKANASARHKTHGTALEAAALSAHRNLVSYREIVKDLLEFHAEADLSPKGDDVHILHRAASKNLPELAEYCIDRGCQVDMITTKGPRYHKRFGEFPSEMTPLAFACAEGHVEATKFLLSRGSSIERTKDPSAVLWTAAYQGHAEVVDLLIKQFKSTHNEKETAEFIAQRPYPKSGHPILWAAASSRDPHTVRVLLDHGATYEPNWFNASPLLATATYAAPEVTELLLQYHREGKVDVDVNKHANNGRTAVWEACALNRFNVAIQLLFAGADYTINDDQDATTLITASAHDDPRLFWRLMRHASSRMDRSRFLEFLNHQPKSAKTAMIECAERNRLPQLNLLLEQGADYTLTGHAGNTPLHWASRQGFDEAVGILLQRASKDGQERFTKFINQRNREGKTALWETAIADQVLTMQALIEAGADYSIPNNNEVTILHDASLKGRRDQVRLLLALEKEDMNQERFNNFLNHRNSGGKTALWDAVDGDRPIIVDLLLQHGIDYTIPNKNNVTALHHASFRGRSHLVTVILVKASKDPDQERFRSFLNAQNSLWKTALWDAVDANRLLVIQILLHYGADYTIPRDWGVTPLHHASFRGSNDIAVELLTKAEKELDEHRFHAFLNYRNNGYKTPLFDAADANRPTTVKLLLDHGADYTIPRDNETTALHCASYKGYKDVVVDVLTAMLKDPDKARARAFLNHRNDQGKTALFDAVDTSAREISKILLDQGADYTIPRKHDVTTLHSACSRGSISVVSELLAAGARDPDHARFRTFLNQRNHLGKTALMDAAERNQADIVSMLLEKGADWSLGDKDDRTALHFCASKNHMASVNALLGFVAESWEVTNGGTEGADRFRAFLERKGGVLGGGGKVCCGRIEEEGV
ncbi:uncharacterized protein KY384_002950 [Bacidia gigantensis]|uniref:uncharacterized protein n=1 Tax=Bacidia gigantensis TaxID=2732470 RepID=UPI001D0391F9|nr:uncharacterized protein KY384_002950 [Bacidia gigantensis]KAG8531321.1 hypothetical protein KY384_002950 [Bacidia gigantensis]